MVLQQATKEGELRSERLLGEHGVREVSLNSLSLGSDGLTAYLHNMIRVLRTCGPTECALPAFFQVVLERMRRATASLGNSYCTAFLNNMLVSY